MIWRCALLVLFLLACMGFWHFTPAGHSISPEVVIPLLEEIRASTWAWPAALALYIVATLLFVPHMAVTALIVLAFRPVEAFALCMVGSTLSASIGFAAGRWLSLKSLKFFIGDSAEKVSTYAKKSGVIGITLLRLLPIAPFTAVNLALAMLGVSYGTFIGGTVLGTLPGTMAASLLGFSLLEVWRAPTAKNALLVGGGVGAWIAIVLLSHFAHHLWKKKSRRRPG